MNVLEYVLSGPFLMGALVTVALTVLSMALGVVGGFVLAGLGHVPFLPARWLARAYIWLFRGTPVLLQLIFVFNVLPFVGLRFDSFTCALIALSLNEAAYMAEIIRGGLMGVSPGQRPAARMLGFSRTQTLVHIVVPQVVRLVLPPTGNQVIGMLKTSALASVVAVQDLMLVAQRTAAGTFDYTGALIAAAVLYLLLTTAVSAGLRALENRMDTSRRSARRRKTAARLLTTAGGR